MPHPTDIHVGQKVREARIAHGMSQTQLGNALGVSFQQVQKYEKGSNRIGSSRLWDVCRIFNTPVSYFFEGLAGKQPADDPLSSRAIKLAREIDQLSNDDVKTHFLKLIRSYSKAS